MKTLILMIAAVLIGLASLSWNLSCRLRANDGLPPEQAPRDVGQAGPRASPPNRDDYKKLLFVDQSLEELVTQNALSDHFSHFIQAYKYVKDGKPDAAKKSLRRVLADPKAEVREKLWAWGALRQLGERPPPHVANEVVGVVLEVPMDGWVDTLAAYSDGRARYLNGKNGGLIVNEVTDDPRLSSLVEGVIRAAKPLVQKAPAFDTHRPTRSDVIRVSILTYGGIRVTEAKIPDVTGSHPMSPVFDAGTRLFLTLLGESERGKQNG